MTRTMKDSGIEWIGEIYEGWSILRNKNVFTCSKEVVGKAFESTQLLSLTTKGVKEKDINDTSGKVPESYETYQFVKPNQIVMCLFDLDCSAVFSGISKYSGMISPAYDILDCKEDKAFSDYYNYWFLFVSENRKFKSYAKNLRYTLKYNEFSCLPVVVPPLPEQQKIATFLDEKCGMIDEIISKTEQSIEEYKKLKQSVITEAVTKGIRANRPMQDSNIEWIGEIPTDWEIKKFRNILKERTEKNAPIKSTERLSLSIDLGITLYAEKTTNLDRFKEDFEQYKIAHEGDLVMNSMNMIIGAVGVSKYYGCVSPVYYTWYDETPNHTTAKYCEYLLRCKTIKKVLFALGRGIYAIERGDDRVNTCRLKISRDDLKNLKLPLPSLDEQAEIISYLDKKCAEIDTLIEKKQQFLTEMANYKKSLIYEYVTGKKEVA